MDGKKGPNAPPPGPLKGMRNNPLLWYVLASIILIMVMNFLVTPKQNIVNVDFSTFKQNIENGQIKRVEMTPSYYLGYNLTKEQAAKDLQSQSGGSLFSGPPAASGKTPASSGAPGPAAGKAPAASTSAGSGKATAASTSAGSGKAPAASKAPAAGNAPAASKAPAAGQATAASKATVANKAPAAGQATAASKAPVPKEVVYRTTPVQDPGFVPLLDSKGVEYFAVLPKNHPLLGILLTWILPFAAMFLLWRFLSRRLGSIGQNAMTFGQNKTRLIAEGDTGVRFSDVAGAEESKAELVEVVDFLKHPGRYTAIGGKIPKGVLLVGAPGTGKTLLARAVAGEAEVTFFRISGSEFVEMFVGVGAARVRDLFQQARGKAPCIIFIDELDAIGKSRATGISTNDEREQTLNQLLVEMDGFDARIGVIILAATNRPEVLDPALLRPGRFDRQVVVDKPDLDGREQILKLHSKGVKLAESVDLREVARRTAGFVGADLANLVNEAAIRAVRSGRQQVVQEDFDEAFEKLVAGLEKKNRLINPKERRIVAYHETGHGVVALLTPGADPVEKISIVPRGISALGYTLQLPTEERFLMTEAELVGKIDVLLGGRAAEQLVFGEISTGAANDLNKAADIARRMITDYGMSEKFRNVFLPSRKQSPFLGENNYTITREYSESTQQYVDEETARIIDQRFQRVLALLKGNKAAIARIAEKLLQVEVLDGREFKKLMSTPAKKAPARKVPAPRAPHRPRVAVN